MAATNQTPNYGLSQFLPTDLRIQMEDYNGDMAKIDTAVKAAADGNPTPADRERWDGKADCEIGIFAPKLYTNLDVVVPSIVDTAEYCRINSWISVKADIFVTPDVFLAADASYFYISGLPAVPRRKSRLSMPALMLKLNAYEVNGFYSTPCVYAIAGSTKHPISFASWGIPKSAYHTGQTTVIIAFEGSYVVEG